ncbi:hypothetical protein BJV82DRAFT_184813 [Fennellomyces sp. T-0311]|nr:hypothetical protein BJV82DRAFT_184813 [Fennellomyces sp. T-0311]
MDTDSRSRIDDDDDDDDDDADAASVDSHNEPVESRALPIDNPRGVDDDGDDDNGIENAVGDDNREYERDEENPLHYTFKEYPYIGQDARTRKSCELYCLVQKQNIARATYHRLNRMSNGWMEDDEPNANREPLFSPFVTEKQMIAKYGVQPKLYRICPEGCRLFPIGCLGDCTCNTPQFKPGTDNEPVRTMSYFPLAKQLSGLVADSKFRESVYGQFSGQQTSADLPASAVSVASPDAARDTIQDITDGSVFKELRPTYFAEATDLCLGLFMDEFTPFKGKQIRLTIVNILV